MEKKAAGWPADRGTGWVHCFGNPGLALRLGRLRYLIVGFLSPVLDEVGTGSTKKAQARHSLQVNTLMYANKGRKQSTRIASHPAQDGDRV